jgi:hypothetical protein
VEGVVRITLQCDRLQLGLLEADHLAVDHQDLLSIVAQVRLQFLTCLRRELVVPESYLDASDLLPVVFHGLPEADVAVTGPDAVPMQRLTFLGRETLKGLSRLSKLVTVLDDAARRHGERPTGFSKT